MKYEVKSGGYSVGITKYLKDAETWFKRANGNLDVQLIEINDNGPKRVIGFRKGNGATIRDISGVQSLT